VKCKRIFGISRVHGTCLLSTYVVLLRWGSEQRSTNPSAGFEGPLQSGRKITEKGRKEGRKGKGKEENGRKGWEKHIRNKFLVTILAVSWPRAVNSDTAFAFSCRTAPGNSVYFLSTRSSLASASLKPRIDAFM